MHAKSGRFATDLRPGAAPARIILPVVLLAVLSLTSACDGSDAHNGPGREVVDSDLRDQLIVVSDAPPQVVASGAADLDRAERFGNRLDPDAMLARLDARLARADSLAWLTGSAEGRRFLAAPLPRAIARGTPSERCPAIGVAAEEPGGRGPTVRRALELCLAAVPEDCGCALIAVDRVLTVGREEMAYATGVTARARIPAPGFDGLLIAEDEPDGSILLRDLAGPVGRIVRGAEGAATLTILDGGARFEGRSVAVGYRRGRLAERFYLEDAGGRRAVVLVGFSPAELAAGAGAGLAWPEEEPGRP